MRNTGRISPRTKKPILAVEFSDILPFLNKPWSNLEIDEKCKVSEYVGEPFLAGVNDPIVRQKFIDLQNQTK